MKNVYYLCTVNQLNVLHMNKRILNNRKIAETILGFKMTVEDYHGINIISSPNGDTFDLHQLRYDSSWDWLMPVVSKIYDMDVYVSYVDETSGMFKNSIELTTNINKVYESVVDFVDWLIENKSYPTEKGQTVKFHTPLEDEDPNEKYTVVEMRGSRVLITPLECDMSFKPQNSVNRKDLTVIL